MTDTRPTPNEEPTTEAGRAMLRDPMYRFAIGHILAIEAEARATATPSSLPAASTTIPRSHTNGTPGTADPRSTGTGQPSSPPAADTSDIGGGSRSSQVPLTPDGAGSASSSYLSVSGRYTEARATATPGLREAAERLIADWDGLRSGLWRALKADVAALRAALSASGETEP